MRNERQTLELGPATLMCTTLRGAQSDAEVNESLREYQQLLEEARARGHKLVDILDIRKAATPSPTQRRLQTDWNREHEQLLRDTLLGFTFVVSSAVMRGVITAVFWIKPLPVPHAVHTELEEAVHWSLDRCRDAGIAISGVIRDDAHRRLVIQASGARTARG
ncbi:MAG: hypothetical protein ABW321_07685 [Polyangiales bacterium]